MTWTTLPPAQPGYWPWRARSQNTIAHVLYCSGGTYIRHPLSGGLVSFAQLGGEWWDAPVVMPFEHPEPVNAGPPIGPDRERVEQLAVQLAAIARAASLPDAARMRDALEQAAAALTTAERETSSGYYAKARDVCRAALSTVQS